MPVPLLPRDITGVILAGGLGSRMGGADKGLLPFAGRPLVGHVIERLAPQVGRLLINANRNSERYASLGGEVIADRISGYPGPLAGLHAALTVAATPLVVSAPCDAPYLPSDLVARLAAGLAATDGQLAIAVADGRLHPVFCLCRTDLAPRLAAYLDAGGRKVAGWCRDMGAVEVDFSDCVDRFRNCNTPDDLAEN